MALYLSFGSLIYYVLFDIRFNSLFDVSEERAQQDGLENDVLKEVLIIFDLFF